MSQYYLTKSEAATKLGVSNLSGNDFVTKADLVACGNADMSKLAGYQDSWYVADDDIQIGTCYICIGENDYRPLNLEDRIRLNIPVGGEYTFWLSQPVSQIAKIQFRVGNLWIGTEPQPLATGNPSATVPALLFTGNVRYFKIIRLQQQVPNQNYSLKFYINEIEYIMKFDFTQ